MSDEDFDVSLDDLVGLTDKIKAFDKRVSDAVQDIDTTVSNLHLDWRGLGAESHDAAVKKWYAEVHQMQEGLSRVQDVVDTAHENYRKAVQANLEMWP
ncbi:WXG100 family type VII secretion target [Gordonia sp. DT101]|uniref:WXG100 family type VII secretion target n=1 Tax=Gordonia sp. DT101 TaxID=3416545 RepID=UPI003CE93F2E